MTGYQLRKDHPAAKRRRHEKYRWIVERARSGEPVPITTTRPDMDQVIDYLAEVDGRGLALQADSTNSLLWVVKNDDV